MKCKVCNAELNEGQSFCSYCGSKVETETAVQEPVVEQATKATTQETTAVVTEPIPAEKPMEEKNPADTHALVGMILGICSLVLCCIGLPSGIIGIIFSIKGLKSKTRKGMAIPGLITSILAVINFFSFWGGFAQGFLEGMQDFEYISVILSNLLF